MSVQTIEKLFGASIKFVKELSNEVTSFYTVKAHGDKHVFDVLVNNLTQEIKVVFADTTEVEIDAKVKMTQSLTESGVTSRPSSDSVKTIIYPRIIGLLNDKLTGAIG